MFSWWTRTPMWFLSHFNSNLIFTLMKSDYITRTNKGFEFSAKFISNNEIVFTNNSHYYLLLCQVYIVFIGVFVNFLTFNLYQTGRIDSFCWMDRCISIQIHSCMCRMVIYTLLSYHYAFKNEVGLTELVKI